MEIKKTNEKTEITVPPNRYWIHVFVFVPAGFIMFLIFCLSLLKILKAISIWNFKDLNFEVFGLLALSLAFIHYALWLTIGKEKLIFHGEQVVYKITNGLFTKTQKLKAANLKNLKSVEKVYNSRSLIFPDEGRIKFQSGEKYFSIFRGLEDEQVSGVVEIINENIVAAKTTNIA